MTIDRPEARNALERGRARTGCSTPTQRFNADDDARVLVLTGAGDQAFCAGGDLKEMAETELQVPPPDFVPQFGRNVDGGQAHHRGGERRGLRRRLPARADVRPLRRGRARAVRDHRGEGRARARRGRRRSPASCRRGSRWSSCSPATRSTRDRAYELGLVNRVVPVADLRDTAQELGERIAANAPLSVAAAKAMVREASGRRPRGLRPRRGALGAGVPERGRAGGPTRVPRAARAAVEGTLTCRSPCAALADDLLAETARARRRARRAHRHRSGTSPRRRRGGRCATRSAISRTSTTSTCRRCAEPRCASRANERSRSSTSTPSPRASRPTTVAAPPAALVQWWRDARGASGATTLGGLDPSARVPWYGPDMSVPTALTARIMETWAHGQDVVDAVGATRAPDAGPAPRRPPRRAHARQQLHDTRPPGARRRRCASSSSRPTATRGRGDRRGASNVVTGPAVDFCLVVTQRRHLARHRPRRARGRSPSSGWRSRRRSRDRPAAGASPDSSRREHRGIGAWWRTRSRRAVRIANCSGFYGDRLARAAGDARRARRRSTCSPATTSPSSRCSSSGRRSDATRRPGYAAHVPDPDGGRARSTASTAGCASS